MFYYTFSIIFKQSSISKEERLLNLSESCLALSNKPIFISQKTENLDVYDFSFLTPCPTSGIIISGKKDELVPFESINDLNKRLSAQKSINVEFEAVADANHFFSKTDQALIKSLNKYIKKESALY